MRRKESSFNNSRDNGEAVEPTPMDRELEVLTMVRDSDEPLGSWALMSMFEQKGVRLSPATIGRVLMQLEQHGYLERKSFKGRVITKKGKSAITDAENFMRMEDYRKRLEELLHSKVFLHFIMVLEARKTIERETARLAAQNITAEEIAQLEALEKKREDDNRRGVNNPQNDIEFHKIIARASHNMVLMIFSEIISMLHQQSAVFDYMRSQMPRPYFISHAKVIEAFKQRNAKAAEKSMAKHIDKLIQDVNTFVESEPKA
jgi:GntR family transcriptional repressor for pyruvate dehydrogenase complex